MPLSVPDVLVEAGWPLGRYGRTTCLLHEGDNRSAFSYTEEVWNCFACGAGGTGWHLAVRLGLRKERFSIRPGGATIPGLSRHFFAHLRPDPRPELLRVTERLRRAVLRKERAFLAVSRALLDGAEDEVSMAVDLWRSGRSRVDVLDAAADAVWHALALEEQVGPEHERRSAFVAFGETRRVR